MKLALLLILFALLPSSTRTQDVSIERAFERERRSLSLVRFAVGEDASSGYDYLVYRRRAQVRKIRSVWNGGCCNDPTVEDFYYKDGNPALYVKFSAKKAQWRRLARGVNLPLRAEEKLYLKDSKLTTWIENGKTVSPSDPRWKDKEKSLLEEFKGQLDNYKFYQDERRQGGN
jgi:hypothetical protein